MLVYAGDAEEKANCLQVDLLNGFARLTGDGRQQTRQSAPPLGTQLLRQPERRAPVHADARPMQPCVRGRKLFLNRAQMLWSLAMRRESLAGGEGQRPMVSVQLGDVCNEKKERPYT